MLRVLTDFGKNVEPAVNHAVTHKLLLLTATSTDLKNVDDVDVRNGRMKAEYVDSSPDSSNNICKNW